MTRLRAAVAYLVALAVWGIVLWSVATNYTGKHRVLLTAFWVGIGIFIAIPIIKGRRKR